MLLDAKYTKAHLIELAIKDAQSQGFYPIEGEPVIFAPANEEGGVEDRAPILFIPVTFVPGSTAIPPLSLPSPSYAPPDREEEREPEPAPGKRESMKPSTKEEDGRRGIWSRLSPEERERRKQALRNGKAKAKAERAIQNGEAPPLVPVPSLGKPSPAPQAPVIEEVREVVAPSVIPFPEPASGTFR